MHTIFQRTYTLYQVRTFAGLKYTKLCTTCQELVKIIFDWLLDNIKGWAINVITSGVENKNQSH